MRCLKIRLVPLFGILALSLLGSCASSEATRDLTAREIEILERLRSEAGSDQRLEDLEILTDDLRANYTSYLREEHVKAQHFTKARTLASMQAFLARVDDDMKETRRDVLLSRLVEVENAEEKALQARIDEWDAKVDATVAAYTDLLPLIDQAIEAEKLVLAHLDRPASARLSGFLDQLRVEIAAFRDRAESSEHEDIRRLADKAEKAEKAADKARDGLEKAMDLISKVRE